MNCFDRFQNFHQKESFVAKQIDKRDLRAYCLPYCRDENMMYNVEIKMSIIWWFWQTLKINNNFSTTSQFYNIDDYNSIDFIWLGLS